MPCANAALYRDEACHRPGIVATSALVDVGEKDLPEGGRFLPKPCSHEQLARVLRELIDGRQV